MTEAPVIHRMSRSDYGAMFLCTIIGGLLGVMPHIANRVHHGTFAFLADNDDVYYLGLARPGAYGEWSTRCPFAGSWENVPELHAWAQVIPWGLAAYALEVPLIHVGMAWRGLGGLAFGMMSYVLCRVLFAKTSSPILWSLFGSTIILTDAGLVGRPLIDSLKLIPHLLEGTTPFLHPNALPQYRAVTPITNIWMLFVVVAVLTPGHARRRWHLVAAILAMAAVVLTYFFYWTATVVTLSALIGVLIVIRWSRKDSSSINSRWIWHLTLVLFGGLLLGSPQILQNMATFFDPQLAQLLEQAHRPAKLSAGDPARWRYITNVWGWSYIALGVLAVIVWRQYHLTLVWMMTLAGFALANSAIVTGMEFENFHWAYVYRIFGEILVISVSVAILDRYLTKKFVRMLVVVTMLLMISFAGLWRWQESQVAGEPVTHTADLLNLVPLQPALAKISSEERIAGPSPVVTTSLLFGQYPLLYSAPYSGMTLLQPGESDRRHALQHWLKNLNVPPQQQPEESAEQYERRLKYFRMYIEDPSQAQKDLDELRVKHLLQYSSSQPPTRGGPWSIASSGPVWTLWSR